MKKYMIYNFNYLKKRVLDSLNKTDLVYIKKELSKINTPTLISGVGGSNVVSEMMSKIINKKNNVITKNLEPRDFNYLNINGYENVISCSYSGNNYGVETSFKNNLKHYLLTNNLFDNSNIIYLKYNSSFEKELSFVSLSSTLIPISIAMSYYLNNNTLLTELIKEEKFNFEVNSKIYEIFSGIDTSVTSKYLESTMVESGIGIPIIHDKYSYCHGRSTLSFEFNNNAIYLNRNTELDKLLLQEISKYYKHIIIINSKFKDAIIEDYQMLIQAIYLTKYIAEKNNKDLSLVNYSPIVKKLYYYKGEM